MNARRDAIPIAGLIIVGCVFAWSMVRPADWFTWFLEVLPVLLVVPILAATWGRFRFTNLVYGLLAAHAVILIIGGHYTYAEMPLFNWIRDTFHQARNNYDKVGHFAQGFVPAMVAREILLRTSPLVRGKWLFAIVVCVCLAGSAAFELFEWQVSAWKGASADAYLGTQGDAWDTQKDMAWALIGSVVAQLSLARVHDKALLRLDPKGKGTPCS
jgi:putative membrane protein